MPIEDIDIKQFLTTEEILSNNGYNHYEISNYCKETKECKHNLHYWKLSPYLSFGPSAHSYDLKKRWWNVRSLEGLHNINKFEKNPIQDSELLTREDNYNEIILNGLRLSNGINRNLLKEYQDIINNESLERVNKKWIAY